MRLAKIHATLNSEPLFCSNGYRAILLELLQQHATLDKDSFRMARTGKARSGSELDVQDMVIRDGIAIIPIGGPIGMDLGEFAKGAGAVDVDDICRELDEAEADESVQAIILNIDSPGGMVTGTPECGARIMAVEKPIYAFTRGTMASAAYWLGSATDGIFATRSADIGCIGVCCAFMDLSRMADMAGIKVKPFGSGTYKGMGTPGTSLSADQEIWMRDRVMKLADMFYQHVRSRRGAVADADMQGQVFKGQEAGERGFIDCLVSGLGELETYLRTEFTVAKG